MGKKGRRLSQIGSNRNNEQWVYLGSEFDRWQMIKIKSGASSDIELLTMLVDSYIKYHMKDSELLKGTICTAVTSDHVEKSAGSTEERAKEDDANQQTDIKMECDSDTESPTEITSDVKLDTCVPVVESGIETHKGNSVNSYNQTATFIESVVNTNYRTGTNICSIVNKNKQTETNIGIGVNTSNQTGKNIESQACSYVLCAESSIGQNDRNTDTLKGVSTSLSDWNKESKEDRVNASSEKLDLWTGAFVDFHQISRKTSMEAERGKSKDNAVATSTESGKSQQDGSPGGETQTTVMMCGEELITIKVEKDDDTENQSELKEEVRSNPSHSSDVTPSRVEMSEKKQFAGNSNNGIMRNQQWKRNTQKSNNFAALMLRQYLKEKDLPQDFEDFDELELAEVLSWFYMGARTKSGDLYKAKTLENLRYSLNRYLKSRPHLKKFDIITNKAFRNSNKCFKMAIEEIKRAGKGIVQHYEKIVDSDIRKLYTSSLLDPSTPMGLFNRVQMNIRFFFGRLANENMTRMHKDTFIIAEYEDGTKYVVKKGDKLTENQSECDNESTSGHMPEDKNHPSICPVATYLKYISKLNPKCDRLWQYPLEIFDEDPDKWSWYQNRPVGRETMNKFMQSLSKKVGLSQVYTNHCIRVTVTSLLYKNEFTSAQIMSIAGSKSINSLSSCEQVTVKDKQAMGVAIWESIQPKPEQKHTVSEASATLKSNSPLPASVNQSLLPAMVILQFPQLPTTQGEPFQGSTKNP